MLTRYQMEDKSVSSIKGMYVYALCMHARLDRGVWDIQAKFRHAVPNGRGRLSIQCFSGLKRTNDWAFFRSKSDNANDKLFICLCGLLKC